MVQGMRGFTDRRWIFLLGESQTYGAGYERLQTDAESVFCDHRQLIQALRKTYSTSSRQMAGLCLLTLHVITDIYYRLWERLAAHQADKWQVFLFSLCMWSLTCGRGHESSFTAKHCGLQVVGLSFLFPRALSDAAASLSNCFVWKYSHIQQN